MSQNRISMLICMFSLWGLSALADYRTDQRNVILGKWQFIGYIFEGQFQDAPNPNLVLTFEFFRDGTDLLHWHRIDEDGICERKGQFTYDGFYLRDEVVWVNPENSFECAKDSDMALGKKEVTPLRYENGQLLMDLPLSDQTLIYVWEKVSEIHINHEKNLRRNRRHQFPK